MCPLTLQLAAPKMPQNFFPIWGVVISPQVWLQLATQNLQCRALADTVCADEPEHLSWAWHGQSMQLEAVGRVSMSNLRLEVGGQIDDVDGIKGTFLRADTATDAEGLGDEGYAGGGLSM
jgi:hypothetical protein